MDFQELVRLVESGQPGAPFAVKVDEGEIAKLANEKAASLVGDVSVDISPSSVTVNARTKVAALVMEVQVIGKPVLEDGSLRFDIESMDLNRRPAPEFIRSQIANAVNEKLDPAQLPVKLTRLELGEGWVEFTGETK